MIRSFFSNSSKKRRSSRSPPPPHPRYDVDDMSMDPSDNNTQPNIVLAKATTATITTHPGALRSRSHNTNSQFLSSSPQQQHTMRNNHSSVSYNNGSDSTSNSMMSTSINPCNSFLLGGSYYPGKDKKKRINPRRVRNAKRGAWCASFLFGLVWIGVVIGGGWGLWHYWQRWFFTATTTTSTSSSALPVQLHDTTLKLLPIELELLDRARLRLRFRTNANNKEEASFSLSYSSLAMRKRHHILEQIVPAWVHRNSHKEEGEKSVEQEKGNGVVVENEQGKEVVVVEDPAPAAGGGGGDEEKEQLHQEEPQPEHGKGDRPSNKEKEVVAEVDPVVVVEKGGKEEESEGEKANTSRKLEEEQQPQQQQQQQQQRPMITLETMHQHLAHSCPNHHHPSTNNNRTNTNNNRIQTTLVIQASVDRLWILKETCRRWADPIVVVVGINSIISNNNNNDSSLSSSILLNDARFWNVDNKNVNNNNVSSSSSLTNVSSWCPQLRLLVQPIEDDPALYPVNRLRNLALDAVTTSHVLVVDADFVPSLHLEETIRKVLLMDQESFDKKKKEQQQQHTNEKDSSFYTALVVPAFERILNPPCPTARECRDHLLSNSSFVPKTFTELQQCVKEKDCGVFQAKDNWEGHYSTRSKEWLQGLWYDESKKEGDHYSSQEGQEDTDANNNNEEPHHHHQHARTLSCFDSLRYEPYVVIRWCPSATGTASSSSSTARAQQHEGSHDHLRRPVVVAPYYDERFYGYGKNKIEYIQHLRLWGYQFQVLPEGFIVHNPHVDSKAKEHWAASNSQLHQDMDQLYPMFLHELVDKIDHNRPIVLPCSISGGSSNNKAQQQQGHEAGRDADKKN